MVCRARQDNVVAVMSNSHHARDVVIACKNSISKMQSVADLLLLSNNNIRPVVIDSLTQLCDAYPQCSESIVTQMKGLLVLTSRIQGYLQNTTSKWDEICTCIQDITEIVVGLIELCSDAAYLCVLSKPSCLPLIPGIVDSYKVSRANLEIHLSCQQIEQLSYTELTPLLLVQLCYNINKNLAILTECCKQASDRTNDQYNEEQFKLCAKSFTACGSCVVSSIKSFKAQPSEATRQRCVKFCEALSASTDALVGFATESQFGWKAGTITPQAEEAKKAILGKHDFSKLVLLLFSYKYCIKSGLDILSPCGLPLSHEATSFYTNKCIFHQNSSH